MGTRVSLCYSINTAAPPSAVVVFHAPVTEEPAAAVVVDEVVVPAEGDPPFGEVVVRLRT